MTKRKLIGLDFVQVEVCISAGFSPLIDEENEMKLIKAIETLADAAINCLFPSKLHFHLGK